MTFHTFLNMRRVHIFSWNQHTKKEPSSVCHLDSPLGVFCRQWGMLRELLHWNQLATVLWTRTNVPSRFQNPSSFRLKLCQKVFSPVLLFQVDFPLHIFWQCRSYGSYSWNKSKKWKTFKRPSECMKNSFMIVSSRMSCSWENQSYIEKLVCHLVQGEASPRR